MKKVLVLLAFAALGLNGLRAQQSSQISYVLNGNLKNFANHKIYFTHEHINDSTMSDAQGNFKLTGTLASPGLGSLVYIENRRLIGRGIWMVSGNITVNGDAKAMNNIKVTGSPDQEIFDEFQAYSYQKMLPYYAKFNEARNRKDTAAMKVEKKAADAIWGPELNRLITQQVIKYPASPTSLYYIQVVNMSKNLKLADSLLTIMELNGGGNLESVKNERGAITSAKNRHVMRIGMESPIFADADSAGKTIDLSSYRGKYVLVDFWASWCGPCRQENPNVVKAYNKFKGENFDILSVSLDNSRSAWIKAVKEDHLLWTQVCEPKNGSNASKLYGVTAIPTNFLIDPSGKIVAISLRGDDLTNALNAIFKK